MDDGWNKAGDALAADRERDALVASDYPDIAIIGKMGAGKTTAADYYVEKCGYRRLSFAGPLKQIAQHIWGQEALTDRAKLQGLGVAVREIDTDAWCNMLVRQVESLRSDMALPGGPKRFVVDDCRFPNEFWALAELGFVFVRVSAPQTARIVRLQGNGKLQDTSQLEHVSETALDDYIGDYQVTNDETLSTFHEQLRDVVLREAARV